jgi:hypothetical protein
MRLQPTDPVGPLHAAPWGGVARPRRVVRFARLIHAAHPRPWRTCGPRYGDNPSRIWLPLTAALDDAGSQVIWLSLIAPGRAPGPGDDPDATGALADGLD